MDHYGGSLGHLVETQSASTLPQLNQAVASGKCMALCLHTCPKEVLALRATPRIRLGDGTGDTGSTLYEKGGFTMGKTGAGAKEGQVLAPYQPQPRPLASGGCRAEVAAKPQVMQPCGVERPVGKGCVGGAGAAQRGTP